MQAPVPPELRYLKWLVTTLAGVMILGIIAIVGLLAFRLGSPPAPQLPEGITVPDGVRPAAVTLGQGWLAVVTEAGDEILIFDSTTGALRQRVRVGP